MNPSGTESTSGLDESLAGRVTAALSRAHGHFAILFDADLQVLWGSETIAEMLGVDDPIGVSILELVHPDDLALATTGLTHHVTHRDAYSEYRADWRPEPLMLRVAGRDGTWSSCEVSLFNHLDDPEIGAFLAVGHTELDRRDLPLAIDLLGSGAHVDEVLPVIARYIDRMLQGSHCEVMWWDNSEDHRVAADGTERFPPPPADLVRELRRTGEAQQLDDVTGVADVPEGIRALRVIPVTAPGRTDVVACVVIWAPMPVGIEAGPQRPVHQAVRLASLAVVDHHAKEALRFEVSHDPLTGLKNRAGFNHAMAGHDGRCALLYVDLDDFKPVNDVYGHQAGDAVLVAVGRRLEAAVRSVDAVARIGGDEFAVLLAAPVDLALATDVATRVIDAVSRPISIGGETVVVGASVGVAMGTGSLDHLGLARRADEALYRAKVAGKRQVAISEAAQVSDR